LGEIVLAFITLLIIGSLFDFTPSYYLEHRLDKTVLENTILEQYPNAEIINDWSIDGNAFIVFKSEDEYRFMFFAKDPIGGKYAINDRSLLYSYFPFHEEETQEIRLSGFIYDYFVTVSSEDVIINNKEISSDKLITLSFSIMASLVVLCLYLWGLRKRSQKYF